MEASLEVIYKTFNMAFGFSNWQEFGIDPISLGQPIMWLTAADPTYLVNATGGTPTDQQQVVRMNRYNDGLFNFSETSSTNRATYRLLPGQAHPYGYVNWSSGAGSSQGQYATGTTTSFSFLHQINNSFTIYWIFKNEPNEAITTSKFQFSTTQSTGNRGAILYLANLPSSSARTISFDVRNDTSGTNATSLRAGFSYNNTEDLPVLLYSIRGDLSVATGQTALYGYKNGVLDNIGLMTSLPSFTAASFTTMRVGNRALGDGRFGGKFGELIIFNGIHDEATHLKICNFLKDKWRIS